MGDVIESEVMDSARAGEFAFCEQRARKRVRLRTNIAAGRARSLSGSLKRLAKNNSRLCGASVERDFSSVKFSVVRSA